MGCIEIFHGLFTGCDELQINRNMGCIEIEDYTIFPLIRQEINRT